MSPKIAIKKLTASDLTFFEWHFNNQKAGNQKAINLNADVFIDVLYPTLPLISADTQGRFPIDLYIFGPGMSGEYNVQRKIIKGETYKNWRLNGEYVSDPSESVGRFNSLQPGDFVIFSFMGDLYPSSAKAVFLAKSIAEDGLIHDLLENFLGKRRMIALSVQELENLILQGKPVENHPIHDLVLNSEIEDAALGGIRGIRKLRSRPSTRRISNTTLQVARENASRIGRTGEEYINIYLLSLKQNNIIEQFEWVSNDNAISAYDFSVNEEHETIFIDVKSTETDFNNSIHISFNELLQMASDSGRYDLYRVFGVQDGKAQLRIARNVGDFARNVLKVFNGLPEGVTPDSISVLPSIFVFEPAISINLEEFKEE